MFSLLGISIFFTIINDVSAEEIREELNTPNVELSIKPVVCMIKTIEQRCEMTITVNWQSDIPINACLQTSEKTFACWQDKTTVKQKFKLTLESDMLFQLINNNKVLMAEKQIKLNIVNAPKYRRRLRAQWSLF